MTFGVIIHGTANVELTSYQWDKILAFLRSRSDLYIGREDHCRRFVAGVLWIARSGAPGVSCPPNTATGTPSLSAVPAGATGAFGRRCITTWPTTRIPNTSSLTVPSSARIRTPLAPRKRGRSRSPGVRAQSGRVQRQSAYHRGRTGQPLAFYPDGRPGERHYPG